MIGTTHPGWTWLCWKLDRIHFVNMVGTSLLFLAALWTSIVNADVSNSLKEMIKRNPPTNISISHGGLGEYTLSWEGNCTCKGKIDYQLDYTYLDSKDSEMKNCRVQGNQKALDFELHRGLLARVRLTYGDNLEITSNWTERTFDLTSDLFAPVDNLTCIFYGDIYYMNCSWDVSENASEDAQFLLSYRERNPSEVYNCTDYLVDGGRNIGCVNHKMRIGDTVEIICISEVNKKDKLPYCRIIKPYSFYKVDSPINVTINKSTDKVKWTLPKFYLKTSCYKFQLNITNLNERDTKLENVTSTNHLISRDHTKKYAVHVRAVVNDDCGKSLIWSDWSKPLIIDPDGKDMSFPTIVAVLAVILVALVLLLVFVCIKWKLLSKLCQPIPDAGENFKGLFEECNGDFQKWINKSTQVTNKAEDSLLTTAKEFQEP